MRLLIVSFPILLLLTINAVHSDPCKESKKESDCDRFTKYEDYRECVRERNKRDVNCQNQQFESNCFNGNCNNFNNVCNSCDCDSCSYDVCKNSCNSCCGDCCSGPFNSCKTASCCHKTCRSICNTNTCVNSCKKNCNEGQKIIEGGTSGGAGGGANVTIYNQGQQPHNITTIIHLNNLINNTNLINVPIGLNNTNVNNITVQESGSNEYRGGDGGSSGTYPFPYIYPYPYPYPQQQQQQQQQQPCCHVVGPRQCAPQQQFPFMKCFHERRRQCGPICTSPIVHYQKYEICDNEINQQQQQQKREICKEQTVYVPQPQPRCAYQPYWPYVTCSPQNNYESCDGCYTYPPVENRCSPYCYDDGFGTGPYYRQGPFYRPGYAPVPSCLQTGLCGVAGYGAGVGGGGGNVGGYYTGGYGYPVDTYEFPFIVNDENAKTNQQNYYKIWEQSGFNSSAIPYFLPWFNVPKDVSIETNIETPKSPRFAQIKLKQKKRTSELSAGKLDAETTTVQTTEKGGS